MLNIPDYTGCHVLFSQFMCNATRWQIAIPKFDAVFAAENRQISVRPTKVTASVRGLRSFTPYDVLDAQAQAFRNRVLPADFWAVMYVHSPAGAVHDNTDAWLTAMPGPFRTMMGANAFKRMMERRAAGGYKDGCLGMVADAKRYGTSAFTAVRGLGITSKAAVGRPSGPPAKILTSATGIVVPPLSAYPRTEEFVKTRRDVKSVSLVDPNNVEGCDGVKRRRDDAMRRMFGF